MNEIKVRYTLDNGNVIDRLIIDNHKLQCIDLNLIILSNCPVDTDYIRSVSIKIIRKEEEENV